MKRLSSLFLVVGAAGVFAALSVGASATKAPESSELSPAPAKENWTQATGDLGNTRYSALTQINTQNVKSLGAAWVSDKFDDAAASRVTPVVHDGVMFLSAGPKVYALDATTGKTIWKFETEGIPLAPTTMGGPGGRGPQRGLPNTQGVLVADGKVFVGMLDATMYALDEKTGKPIWHHLLNSDVTPIMRGGVSAAPVYVNGVIYTENAFDEGRYMGRAIAIDANDGHELWTFKSIPAPGEPGHETWGTSDVWRMGGANVWLPPVVDVDLGLVYYGTGNPSPNRSGAATRPGNNLYSCSVIALDMKTGKLRWYYQLTHHDLWEGDLAMPLVMYVAQVDGKPRKALAAFRTDGTLFFLDRATGKPVWPVEERRVRQNPLQKTSPTQPFPVGRGSLIERDCSQWPQTPGFITRCEFFNPQPANPPNVLSYGSSTRSAPISYSAQTGYFYIQGIDRMDWEWTSDSPNNWEFGLPSNRVPNNYKHAVQIYAAVDPQTYKIVWRKQMRTPPSNYGVGGWLTTAGGLAFHRMEDGNLIAYDAKTGDELWEFQCGVLASDTASPMSYEGNGEQYVAVIQSSQVWGFKLGGTIAQRPAPPLPARDEIFQGPIEDTQTVRLWVPNNTDNKDEIGPLKARVKVGVPVTFLNSGSEEHTVVADDDSWTTGPLLPRQGATVSFPKAGDYLYHFKEHPWTYGEIIAVENAPGAAGASGRGGASAGSGAGANAGANAGVGAGQSAQGATFAAQVARGKDAYEQQCSVCHQSDLSGSDMIPALAGSPFMARWQGHTAKDLFDRARTTMPTNAPGSLSPQMYLDLVAYVLQVNNLTQAGEVTASSADSISIH